MQNSSLVFYFDVEEHQFTAGHVSDVLCIQLLPLVSPAVSVTTVRRSLFTRATCHTLGLVITGVITFSISQTPPLKTVVETNSGKTCVLDKRELFSQIDVDFFFSQPVINQS